MKIVKTGIFLLSIMMFLSFCKQNKNIMEYTNNNSRTDNALDKPLMQENVSGNNFQTGNDSTERKLTTEIESKNGKIDKSIFDNDIFYNIFDSPDYYIDNINFNYEEIIPEDPIKGEPEKYIIVENNEIWMLFSPDYYSIGYDEWKLNEKYKLQAVTIKQKTNNYFFGKYLGITSDEIINEYPNFNRKFSKTGEGHIMYSSNGWEKFINFTLEDNIVIRITFGFEP
jgi:hypothetical protein